MDFVFSEKAAEASTKKGFSKAFVLGSEQAPIVGAKSLAALRKKLSKKNTGPVFFLGGAPESNRLGVRDERIRVLFDPVDLEKKALDPQTTRVAKENGVVFAYSFSKILNTKGFSRARLLEKTRESVLLCRKIGLKTLLCSGAQNEWETRSPRDLACFFSLTGFSKQQAEWSMSEVAEYVLEVDKLGTEG